MTTELREELERQYDRAEAAAAEQERQKRPEIDDVLPAPAEDYSEAPRSYKKEYAETFKTLPLAMRKYLHERESETEKGFSRISNELNRRRWIDDTYASRAERLGKLGISKAQDWVETMARIDDALDTDPNAALQQLAQIYGVNLHSSAAPDFSKELSPLLERLNELDSKFCRFADDYKAKSQDEEQLAASKKAREASFAPKGKNSTRDLSELTTREVLELKFADYDE